MQYKTEVYISNVTNLSDARYAAGMLVEMVGFPLDEAMDKSIDLNTFGAIIGWLEGINIVAEFEVEPLDSIERIVASYQPTYVSIPYSRSMELLDITCPVILRINVQQLSTLDSISVALKDSISYLQIQGSGTLNDEQNQLLKALSKDWNILLETGMDKNNLNLIELSGVKGIVLSGGDEERPGYKDYDEIADILELWEV